MTVLVVDDDRANRTAVARYLRAEGMETAEAENGLAAQRLLGEERYDVVLLDVRMPGMSGLDLLAWMTKDGPRVPVIMVSAYGEVADAVTAMKLGARDYIVKPVDPDELVLRLRRLAEASAMERSLEAGRTADEEAPTLGVSRAMREIETLVAKIGPTPSTVLITGESGTGKEVVARRIHAHSGRAEEPFVAVNLGGLPEALVESELFGHERGAFTGADTRRVGMFEIAGKGTIFLDEVGEMPAALQVKLLRTLQDRRIRRLGSSGEIPVAARIIAATNRDLEDAVASGGFREDLYYRLNVVRIRIPPLRERPEDIPLLAGALLRRISRRLGREIDGLSSDALERLARYPFPGNVRELENIVERAAIFAEGRMIEPRDLVLAGRNDAPVPPEGTLRELEREAIIRALARWEGNRTRAAEELGISRRTLLYRIKEYGLDSRA